MKKKLFHGIKFTYCASVIFFANHLWADNILMPDSLPKMPEIPKVVIPTINEQTKDYHQLVALKKEQNKIEQNLQKTLDEKNQEIARYITLTKEASLKLKSEDVGLKERFDIGVKKRELASNIENKDNLIAQLKGEITERDQKIHLLEMKLKKQDQFLKKMASNMSERIEKTIKELKDGTKMGTPEQLENLVAQKNKLDELLQYGMDESKSRNSVEKKLTAYQNAYQKIVAHNISLSESLRGAENEMQNLKIKLAQTMTEKETVASELSVWKRYAITLESDFNRKESEYYIKQIEIEGKYANTVARIKELESHSVGAIPYRMPASLTSYDNAQENNQNINDSIAEKLYKGLSERLKESNLNIKTSYTSGSISLTIEDHFLFSSDSSVISEKSKDRLHNLIVIYTEELFSDPEIRDKISQVQFVGHSSPWYKGAYLPPNSPNVDAHKHNITLSAKRALEVVNYIFSGDFSDFPHKEALRSKIIVSGKGHQEPVPLRGPASERQKRCGGYDCQKSRRVEIIFSLKASDEL